MYRVSTVDYSWDWPTAKNQNSYSFTFAVYAFFPENIAPSNLSLYCTLLLKNIENKRMREWRQLNDNATVITRQLP